MDEVPVTLGDPEAYAALARQGLTLVQIGRRVGRSPEHARQVLLRGGHRTPDLRPPRPPAPPPAPRPTAVCAVCGVPVPYLPVGPRYRGGPRYCRALSCRAEAARRHRAACPEVRAAQILANRRAYWRRAHGAELPPELDRPRGQQYCAACGAPTAKYLPLVAVRYCNRPACQRVAKRAHDRGRDRRDLGRVPQVCSVCGAAVRQNHPRLAVRYCAKPECQATANRAWQARTRAAQATPEPAP